MFSVEHYSGCSVSRTLLNSLAALDSHTCGDAVAPLAEAAPPASGRWGVALLKKSGMPPLIGSRTTEPGVGQATVWGPRWLGLWFDVWKGGQAPGAKAAPPNRVEGGSVHLRCPFFFSTPRRASDAIVGAMQAQRSWLGFGGRALADLEVQRCRLSHLAPHGSLAVAKTRPPSAEGGGRRDGCSRVDCNRHRRTGASRPPPLTSTRHLAQPPPSAAECRTPTADGEHRHEEARSASRTWVGELQAWVLGTCLVTNGGRARGPTIGRSW